MSVPAHVGPAVSAKDRQRPVTSLDIVIPIFNEEQTIELLIRGLTDAFPATRCADQGLESWRVIFVDDGSSDRSAELVGQHLLAGFPGVCLRLSRNFGHQPAVSAGLDWANADAVAVMDADLQDPPELIWEMMARLRQGYHVAYAQRMNRSDSAFKRFGCWAFYRLVSLLSETQMPVDSGDFCLMRRQVLEAIRSLPEHLRFPRFLRAWVGFRQIGVGYSRPDRAAGTTKYSWKRLYRLATDGVASASIRPLRLAQIFAWSYMAVSLLGLAALLAGHRGLSADRGLMLLLLLVVNVCGFGLIMFCVYILGAYVGRMYLEVKSRPTYIIMETLPDPAALQPPTPTL